MNQTELRAILLERGAIHIKDKEGKFFCCLLKDRGLAGFNLEPGETFSIQGGSMYILDVGSDIQTAELWDNYIYIDIVVTYNT